MRARPLLLALAATAALGACRQTVILDPGLDLDGSAGTAAGFGGATGGGGTGGQSGQSGKDGGADGPTGAAGTGGRLDGGRPEGGFCFGGPGQQLGITLRAPDLVFAVDRSAAMQTTFGTGTRLQVIQTYVLELIFKYSRAVRFGYEEFPAAKEMCNNGLGCCAGEVTPPTGTSINAIQHVINDCGGGNSNGCVLGQRPLGDALAKIQRTFMSLNSAGRNRYLIVLTGGDPTCGGNNGGGADGGTSSPCDNAANTVTDLSRDQDVSTAIFGVGDEAIGSMCLDKLASNGGLGNVGKPAYRLALTPNDLNQKLAALVKGFAEESCRIDVRSQIFDPGRVQLYIHNQLVPIDGVDGWTFDSGTTSKITVHGSWCNTLIQQTDSNDIELTSGCPRP